MGRLLNSLGFLISALLTWHLIAAETQVDNSTVHLFLVMVPESKIASLGSRFARQEEVVEGALGGILDANGPAAAVSQILQGVLGGDVRPIFAGTIGFIPEGDFRDGVSQVLQQTVGPAIHMILMEFSKNVQMAFNVTSPRPNQQNNTNPNQLQQQNNFNQFQQGQGQFQPNYNQFQQQQGFPSNNQNQFQPGNFQQGQFQPGNFPQNQQQGNFQQNQYQPGNNFYPNNQQNQFFPQNGLPNQQNQIQSPTFQQQNHPNQLPSGNFQQNYNQFQQNIHPQQQPNFNQQNNGPNFNNRFQVQQADQSQSNFNNKFQQHQNIIPAQPNLNQLNQQAQNLGQSININPGISPRANLEKVVPNAPSSKKLNRHHPI